MNIGIIGAFDAEIEKFIEIFNLNKERQDLECSMVEESVSMIDENLNCYLIEVNSSPAWDYSTEITKKLVKEATEDLVKVVIDYGFASQKKKKDINTGKFMNIFKE